MFEEVEAEERQGDVLPHEGRGWPSFDPARGAMNLLALSNDERDPQWSPLKQNACTLQLPKTA